MIKPTVEEIMTQVHVFAGAWSRVGTRFGGADSIEHAEHEKERLRQMVKALAEDKA